MTLVPRILEGLKENGAEDVLVVLGGTIPTEDASELQRQGVAGGLHAGGADLGDRRLPEGQRPRLSISVAQDGRDRDRHRRPARSDERPRPADARGAS